MISFALSLFWLAATLFFWPMPAWCAPKSLTDFSLEELMAMEVTSVAKAPQPLSQAAAAVFVINAEDIRRSGAGTIPDLLRMVPGMQVAKIDANKWAVSARGFNGRFANKLLVMIDGRSIYTPLFAGVHWEIHDLVLEDVERIEVVRGPGGSLWGANAVNGVINIITRHAAHTQGTLVSAAAGSEEYASVTARHGWQSGDDNHFRIFAKYSGQGPGEASTHEPSDDLHRHRAGLRFDREIDPRTSLTLQAEAYGGKAGQTIVEPLLIAPYARQINDDADFDGGFLLGRWQKELATAGDLSVQAYLDRGSYEDFVFDHRLTTYDFDFQHRFLPLPRHELTWGLGYRRMDDRLDSTLLTSFAPPKRTDHLWSAFVQDRITLVPERLEATLGTKWEHNDYTGVEWQPNLR
ncbi:TonB-dependent receptor plug domain-containing protein, partial [Geoalkalibacter sp.]|uniref:TonB-dependent receptor plug domain-containing protein n=1 Tax=Geoalkalibacter sp. TaxID=3041440 RepID=UPI00272DFDF1